MQMINYRIYGNHRQFGWELLNTVFKEEKVYEFVNHVNPNEYMTVMAIRHDFERNSDQPFLVKHLNLEKPFTRSRKK